MQFYRFSLFLVFMCFVYFVIRLCLIFFSPCRLAVCLSVQLYVVLAFVLSNYVVFFCFVFVFCVSFVVPRRCCSGFVCRLAVSVVYVLIFVYLLFHIRHDSFWVFCCCFMSLVIVCAVVHNISHCYGTC